MAEPRALITFLTPTIFLLTIRTISAAPCGGYFTSLKGYIYTPNFPKPYKVPIQCQWVFDAPAGYKVAVYFTQFYMKRGLVAADYTYYSQHLQTGVGKFEFGTISSDDEPTYLVSNQQILVLTMNVRSLDNIHLRVREHILDVSGFNITYEMILKNETVRNDACIYHHCSFTGYCYASADFNKYACKCFNGYFGEECQYDDACGPNSTSEVCQNGGTCRYYIGSSVRTCECLPGYVGAKCEGSLPSGNDEEPNETDTNCQRSYYSSPQGYISVYPKRRKCLQEGALQILSLEISEAMPVNEGVPLLVACIVQSSDDTKVTWLKDGFPIAIQKSAGRIWTMQVPKDSSGWSSFLLGFDKVNEHDTGTITCNAYDDRQSEALSVSVTVRLRSKLLIEPLAATLAEGNSTSITCVSKEGIYGSSGYRWLKNGGDLDRKRDDERVEDLYPGGTRLILRKAKVAANYTCVMRTVIGFLRQTSCITVVNGSDFNKRTCHPERRYGIRWKATAANAFDIQQCPVGYTGYIKRRCKVRFNGKIEWNEPDFSTCYSPPILAIKKEMDSWQMGYRKKTVNAVLDELYDFLSTRLSSLHPSEGEPIVDMMFDTDILSNSQTDFESTWNLFLNSASLLLHSNLVYKRQQKLKLQQLIRRISVAYGGMRDFQTALFFQTACLRVDIFKATAATPTSLQLPWCSSNEAHCRNLSFSLVLNSADDSKESGNATFKVITVVYKCLHIGDLEETYSRRRNSINHFPTFSVDANTIGRRDAVPEIETVLKPYSVLSLETDFKAECVQVHVQNKSISIFPCELMTSKENCIFCRCRGSGIFSVIASNQPTSKSVRTEYFHSKVCFITGFIITLFIILQNIWRISWRIK
ncbi:uncharacterized protein LOC129971045 [Argiope bruennichi]|uniref:uncharacterized protein LOC129971045 n=1 Tax=Argiope bruennichi TaxID=94029 RepID=UPI0024951142|nr:uncharacterized protein LOC129971045 [Argiope bruennichi]